MPICKKCKIKFPNRCYINNKMQNLSTRKYCLICSPFGKHNTRQLEETERKYPKKLYNHRKRVQQKALDYKGGKCIICGYNKAKRSLVFHHKDPEQKELNIASQCHSVSWERLKTELNKCILICANCHGEIHDGLVTI